MEEDWEKEFPLVFDLGNSEKRLRLFEKIERFYRKFVILLTWGVIVYFMYLGWNNTDSTHLISLWQPFRNKLLLFTLFNFVLVIPIIFSLDSPSEDVKLKKIVLKIFKLFMFVIFSFAIAGLVLDFIYFFISLNSVILKIE